MQSRGRPHESASVFREAMLGVFCDGGKLRSRSGNRDDFSGRNDGVFRKDSSGWRGLRNQVYEAQRRRERAGSRSLGGWSKREVVGRMEQSRSRWSRSRSRLERRSRSMVGSQQRPLSRRNSGVESDCSRIRRLCGHPSLLLRNLPRKVSPKLLRTIFEQFGPMMDVHLQSNFFTGELRGFGFVKFQNSEDTIEAKDFMNHEFIGGWEVQIVFADDNRKPPQGLYASSRTRNTKGRRLSPMRVTRGQNHLYSYPPS